MSVSGSTRSTGGSTRSSGTSVGSTRSAGSTKGTTTTKGTTSTRTATGYSSKSSFTPASAKGSLRTGMSGASVSSLQDRLRSAGFDPGPSDGKYGPRTESAVKDYQRSQGLQVDGIAGRRTMGALNGTQGTSSKPSTAANGTASLNQVLNGKGMTTGNITVNGHTYQFNSGGRTKFSTPQGTYRVTAHRNTRSDPGFVRDGVGYSFRMEDARRPNSDAMYDARAGRDRTALRIHPDGGATGTSGCIGIVGDAATQRQFRADMNAELARNGGSYTLNVR
ncbi:peptidoglycan-binding domain-containing protein [Hyalangium versicolor]|uniref:peptidoglycan-binding domain-containing protein n=1 Tax=Hyalangium versicolor TaxID=2861190 RepID=UPI001CCC3D2F|nr:peptidoglycan-binding domain-containing protein [Hyalangium versicolor]